MDLADKFLKENDRYFKRKSRKNDMRYPYLSEQQLRYRRKKEIPTSSIKNRYISQRLGEDRTFNNEN